MHKDDMPAFLKLMMGIGHLYDKDMDEHLIDLYWLTLRQFSFQEVKHALEAHVLNPDIGQFLPKPADIVRYLQGSSQTQAMKAWTKVYRAIGQVGSYDTVIFDDPLIHVVIDEMGGWIALCKTAEKEIPFRGKEFEKRYMGYVLHPPQTFSKKLLGRFEAENQLQGIETQRPICIGEFEKTQQVYRQGSPSSHLPMTRATPALLQSLFNSMQPEEGED